MTGGGSAGGAGTPARVAVVGAGPAGCAAAWALHRRGVDVRLFESAPVVGGRTRSVRDDGRVLDTGAGFFTSFYPVLQAHLDALDLQDQVVPLVRRNVLVRDGVAHDVDLGSAVALARLGAVGWVAKARMAAATAGAVVRHRRRDLSDPGSLAPVDDRSAADHARAVVGGEAYDHLVRPGLESFWYASCEDVSRALLVALQARAPRARFATLRDGMDTICRAVADRLPAVHLAVPVRGLTVRGDHIVVRTERDEVEVDGAVVATTAGVAADLVAGVGDDVVHPAVRTFLAGQRYVSTVHATFEAAATDCPPDVSAAFPCGPGSHPIAALGFNRSKSQGRPGAHGDREVISAYLSAAEAAAHLDDDDAELSRHVWARARACWPVLPEAVEPDAIHRHREAIPLHEVGRYRLAASCWDAQSGPIRFAGDHLTTATVDGALAAGVRAADGLLGTR